MIKSTNEPLLASSIPKCGTKTAETKLLHGPYPPGKLRIVHFGPHLQLHYTLSHRFHFRQDGDSLVWRVGVLAGEIWAVGREMAIPSWCRGHSGGDRSERNKIYHHRLSQQLFIHGIIRCQVMKDFNQTKIHALNTSKHTRTPPTFRSADSAKVKVIAGIHAVWIIHNTERLD